MASTNELSTWSVSIRADKGAKLAAAYELPWWMLRMTRDELAPVTSSSLTACFERSSGRSRQEALLGRKPYKKQRFEYAAAHSDRAVTERALHWLRLAMGIWSSELPHYAQDNRVIFDSIPRAEEESRRPDGARCDCGLCEVLLPSPAHEFRLLSLMSAPLDFYKSNTAGLWIASLLQPSDSLVRALLAKISAMTSDETAVYAGQFRVTKAFALLARRVPSAAAIMREQRAASDPWVRAVALATAEDAISDGQLSFSEVEEDVARALHEGARCETLVSLSLLVKHPPSDHAAWTPRLLEAVRRAKPLFPDAQFATQGLRALWRMYDGRALPDEVRRAAEDYVASVPVHHVAGRFVRELLAQQR